ncbi:unnamed protein product [Rhodiola kirilowii]
MCHAHVPCPLAQTKLQPKSNQRATKEQPWPTGVVGGLEAVGRTNILSSTASLAYK